MPSDAERQFRDGVLAPGERARAYKQELVEAPGRHALAVKRELFEARVRPARAAAEEMEAHQRHALDFANEVRRASLEALAAGHRMMRHRVQAGRFRRALALAAKGRQVRRPDRWARRMPSRAARPSRRRSGVVRGARSPAREPDPGDGPEVHTSIRFKAPA